MLAISAALSLALCLLIALRSRSVLPVSQRVWIIARPLLNGSCCGAGSMLAGKRCRVLSMRVDGQSMRAPEQLGAVVGAHWWALN